MHRAGFDTRPVVTLVIANGLRYGTRAALTNIARRPGRVDDRYRHRRGWIYHPDGDHGHWFDWVRFAGAAYLVWLGIKLIRSPVEGVDTDEPLLLPRGGFFLQGFLVLLSNPKVLVFFGAFIPEFMDLSKDHFSQVALLGFTFMVTGAVTDSIYALLAGRARLFFCRGADAAAVARLRRVHDRRRRLAGVDAGKVSPACG